MLLLRLFRSGCCTRIFVHTGVLEDVTDLILNIKGIAVSLESEGAKEVRLHAEGPLEVTAGMINETAGVEIMNPDHIICHLDKEATLVMELTMESGKGYVPSSQNRSEDSLLVLSPLMPFLALFVR